MAARWVSDSNALCVTEILCRWRMVFPLRAPKTGAPISLSSSSPRIRNPLQSLYTYALIQYVATCKRKKEHYGKQRHAASDSVFSIYRFRSCGECWAPLCHSYLPRPTFHIDAHSPLWSWNGWHSPRNHCRWRVDTQIPFDYSTTLVCMCCSLPHPRVRCNALLEKEMEQH